jgi:hypothetical protein
VLLFVAYAAYDGTFKWVANIQASMAAERDRLQEEQLVAKQASARATDVSAIAAFYFSPDAGALAQLKQFAPAAVAEYVSRTSGYWTNFQTAPLDGRTDQAKLNFGCSIIDEIARLGLKQSEVEAKGLRLGAEGLLHVARLNDDGTC